jgi:hypothetical protein
MYVASPMQLDPAELHREPPSQREIAKETVFRIEDLAAYYGRAAAIKDVYSNTY